MNNSTPSQGQSPSKSKRKVYSPIQLSRFRNPSATLPTTYIPGPRFSQLPSKELYISSPGSTGASIASKPLSKSSFVTLTPHEASQFILAFQETTSSSSSHSEQSLPTESIPAVSQIGDYQIPEPQIESTQNVNQLSTANQTPSQPRFIPSHSVKPGLSARPRPDRKGLKTWNRSIHLEQEVPKTANNMPSSATLLSSSTQGFSPSVNPSLSSNVDPSSLGHNKEPSSTNIPLSMNANHSQNFQQPIGVGVVANNFLMQGIVGNSFHPSSNPQSGLNNSQPINPPSHVFPSSNFQNSSSFTNNQFRQQPISSGFAENSARSKMFGNSSPTNQMINANVTGNIGRSISSSATQPSQQQFLMQQYGSQTGQSQSSHNSQSSHSPHQIAQFQQQRLLQHQQPQQSSVVMNHPFSSNLAQQQQQQQQQPVRNSNFNHMHGTPQSNNSHLMSMQNSHISQPNSNLIPFSQPNQQNRIPMNQMNIGQLGQMNHMNQIMPSNMSNTQRGVHIPSMHSGIQHSVQQSMQQPMQNTMQQPIQQVQQVQQPIQAGMQLSSQQMINSNMQMMHMNQPKIQQNMMNQTHLMHPQQLPQQQRNPMNMTPQGIQSHNLVHQNQIQGQLNQTQKQYFVQPNQFGNFMNPQQQHPLKQGGNSIHNNPSLRNPRQGLQNQEQVMFFEKSLLSTPQPTQSQPLQTFFQPMSATSQNTQPTSNTKDSLESDFLYGSFPSNSYSQFSSKQTQFPTIVDQSESSTGTGTVAEAGIGTSQPQAVPVQHTLPQSLSTPAAPVKNSKSFNLVQPLKPVGEVLVGQQNQEESLQVSSIEDKIIHNSNQLSSIQPAKPKRVSPRIVPNPSKRSVSGQPLNRSPRNKWSTENSPSISPSTSSTNLLSIPRSRSGSTSPNYSSVTSTSPVMALQPLDPQKKSPRISGSSSNSSLSDDFQSTGSISSDPSLSNPTQPASSNFMVVPLTPQDIQNNRSGSEENQDVGSSQEYNDYRRSQEEEEKIERPVRTFKPFTVHKDDTWIYIDEHKAKRGPYTNAQMRSFFDTRVVSKYTKVKKHLQPDRKFTNIGFAFPNLDNAFKPVIAKTTKKSVVVSTTTKTWAKPTPIATPTGPFKFQTSTPPTSFLSAVSTVGQNSSNGQNSQSGAKLAPFKPIVSQKPISSGPAWNIQNDNPVNPIGSSPVKWLNNLNSQQNSQNRSKWGSTIPQESSFDDDSSQILASSVVSENLSNTQSQFLNSNHHSQNSFEQLDNSSQTKQPKQYNKGSRQSSWSMHPITSNQQTKERFNNEPLTVVPLKIGGNFSSKKKKKAHQAAIRPVKKSVWGSVPTPPTALGQASSPFAKKNTSSNTSSHPSGSFASILGGLD